MGYNMKDHHISGNHGVNPICFAKLPLSLIMPASICLGFSFRDKVM